MKTLPTAPLTLKTSCCEPMEPTSCCAPVEPAGCCAPAESVSCCTPAEPTGCCGGPAEAAHHREPWMTGEIKAGDRKVPVASTTLNAQDRLGAWKVRWGIGRNTYTVAPGLYAVGKPDDGSPVLVTANYKLTFDTLRQELSALNAWVLVLDTKGVNVWCAAGKGTFGTEELIKRVRAVNLAAVVSHKTLIVPQLGAPGVAAHTVARRTGFNVVYGPVRASDVQAFLKANMTATPEMRRVTFGFADRVVLTPVELVMATKYAVFAFGLMFLLNGLGMTGFSGTDAMAVLGAVVAGTVVSPALLPWIPGRRFSVKGILLGLVWAAALIFTGVPTPLAIGSYVLLLPAIAGFLSLNFTGSSTYTSFSGVKREMELMTLPVLGAGVLGAVLLIADAVIRLR